MNSNMKKYVLVLMALAFSLVGCNRQLDFYEKCKKEADMQTQRICPRKVDTGIILDSIKFSEQEKAFKYYYTMEDSLFARDLLIKYKEEIRQNLCKNIVNSIELKKYKEKGISFQYIYFYRKTKEKALAYTFTQNDYNK